MHYLIGIVSNIHVAYEGGCTLQHITDYLLTYHLLVKSKTRATILSTSLSKQNLLLEREKEENIVFLYLLVISKTLPIKEHKMGWL